MGCAMLAHLGFLCWLKMERGIEGELLWVSHVSLALTGVGLVIGSGLCLSTALVCVGVLHGLWLIDLLVLGLAGWSPFGATGYLVEADALTWLGTGHHFYLLPLLLVLAVRGRCFRACSVLTATLVFGVLVVLSRAVLPPEMNINGAHALFPGREGTLIRLINGLPGVWYVVVLVVGVGSLVFWPWAMVLGRVCRGAVPEPGDCENCDRDFESRWLGRA